MFSASIGGTIKRVLHDNEKDKKDAMMKVVVQVKKQFTKEDDLPFWYPVITVFGYDAAYLRDYAGIGHWVTFTNCEFNSYRGDDDDTDRISFVAGKIDLLPRELSEAVADAIGQEWDADDDKKSKKKGGKSSRSSKSDKGGKSRSERRGRNRDEDEEEDVPKGRNRRSGKASDGAKKNGSKKSSSSKRRRDDDEDYDDEDDYEDDDDDDNYFDDED